MAPGYYIADQDSVIKPNSLIVKPEIFETAFLPGTEVKEDTTLIRFHKINIGEIDVESGRLIASEPWSEYNEQPFTTQFPIGQFPVELAIAKISGSEIVAFSRIVFYDTPVDHWEFALQEGQKQISIFGDSIYFYPVDSGIGQFIDDSSYNNFQRLDSISQAQAMDFLSKELDKNQNLYANINYQNVNIVAFSSGLGDGRYGTYVGFDKNETPCRLLTDFELIDWRKK